MYILLEMAAILITAGLIFTDAHLRRRDTVESKRVFNIAILTILSAAVCVIQYCYDDRLYTAENKEKLIFVIPAVLLSCMKEMMALQVVIGWNMFVDFAIYRSYDHVYKKHRRSLIPCIVVSVVFCLIYIIIASFFSVGGLLVSIMRGFSALCFLLQMVFVVNAILIVVKAKKGRKPPSFLRLDAFLIPVALGYVMSFIPIAWDYDYRSVCLAVAVVLTWRSVVNRYKYVDPYTGFYNREFLSSMNEYMEKSGYPNGVGVVFKAPGSGGKLIPVLDAMKPADAELFSLGEDEYLLMAGPQTESVLRLLVKSVKLKAKEFDGIENIESSYAIRGKDETSEAFTRRLLALQKLPL